jgi:uncharacterized membrane protein YidH (DUF202 family)
VKTLVTRAILLSLPVFLHAQIDPSNVSNNITISGIFSSLTEILNLTIPFLVLVATVVFIFGIVRYLTAGGDEQRLEQAKQLIFWGIIALAVMLTVWGFVNILIDALFGTQNLPNIPGPSLEPFL